MKKQTQEFVRAWFDGLNRGDMDGLLTLFGSSPRIRNAANPPVQGPNAPHQLLDEFFTRTSARHFELIDAAEADALVFVSWLGQLTFRKGVRIADVLLPDEMTVELRGCDRFKLDQEGRIEELDIVHETSSVPAAARRLAGP